MDNIKVKRVYDQVHALDGKRILVDRLWPRGLSKEKAAIHIWMKDLAPSHELRKWFDHEPDRFEAFKESYLKELLQNDAQIKRLQQVYSWAEIGIVTLIYAAKDKDINQAVVLKEVLSRLIIMHKR